MCLKRKLELLAPAADKEVARQAILHGADAVYIGGPSHGARKKASNSIEDISEVVQFAHQFHARVYVTVNTLVYENELESVRELCSELYNIGVDALIVQDMALLMMRIPPIALHASTQCDTRTPAKARFLADVGFSQIVLARELSLAEISKIHETTSVPLEVFVHGALCVSYSGRCGASFKALGRSANRGECAQMCRMAYTLRNARGEILEKDKYLLSLKDFNTLDKIEDLALAGASSFKIEGRLKDVAYVKNVTAAYRRAMDKVIERYPERFERSSFGTSTIDFVPNLSKSFNRGFTDYFIAGRHSGSMASLNTPKSMGEEISDIRQLNNGDGISFFNHSGEYEGIGVNKVENGRIISSKPFVLPAGAKIHRTFDRHWTNLMNRDTAVRTIAVDISVDDTGISAIDERGVRVRIALDIEKLEARKPMDLRPIFAKLGGTIYRLREFSSTLDPKVFIPASKLTELRRRLVEELNRANQTTYPFDYRRSRHDVYYPNPILDSRDNVANSLAYKFYREHGVRIIPAAREVKNENWPRDAKDITSNVSNEQTEEIVMTTRYCLRRELGCCQKDSSVSHKKRERFAGPLSISTGPHTYRLDFDCANCEMNVVALK